MGVATLGSFEFDCSGRRGLFFGTPRYLLLRPRLIFLVPERAARVALNSGEFSYTWGSEPRASARRLMGVATHSARGSCRWSVVEPDPGFSASYAGGGMPLVGI